MAQQKGKVTGLIAITGHDGGSDDVGGGAAERSYNYRLTQRWIQNSVTYRKLLNGHNNTVIIPSFLFTLTLKVALFINIKNIGESLQFQGPDFGQVYC